jgi:hypothetical protein
MKRDKHNLLSDPFQVKEKADKAKEANREHMKKRAKGTSGVSRDYKLKYPKV